MKDVQNDPADIGLSIDRVGVKNFSIPIVTKNRGGGSGHTVASVDLFVDLPAKFKGTHMSRFVEVLQDWSGELDYNNCKSLLKDIRKRLKADKAHLCFRFPFFLMHKAPVTGKEAMIDYQCLLVGDLDKDSLNFTIGVEVPIMTVCPCSQAISKIGAHSQRALVRIEAGFNGLLWIEELIEIGRSCGSSPVYAILKRKDEKFVTEQSFANPSFVEDSVRRAAQALIRHPKITWFKVQVESFESIHNHSAYACIEKGNNPADGKSFLAERQ